MVALYLEDKHKTLRVRGGARGRKRQAEASTSRSTTEIRTSYSKSDYHLLFGDDEQQSCEVDREAIQDLNAEVVPSLIDKEIQITQNALDDVI